jgi:alkylation response protein AidB-like acyl-CoA dehydrogenase
VDLEPTADQMALVDELRRLLASAPSWDDLAAMGVLTLPIAEDAGGVGLGWAEAALAFQALGHAAVAGPFVATAAARAVGLAHGVTGLVPDIGGPVLVEHLDCLDALLAVSRGGVRRVPLPLVGARPVERPLDPGTPVHLAPVLPDGEVVGEADTARRLCRHAALLAAAMQGGLGTAALERATAYAGQREQFGRPIGSFQALKHLLADAAVGLEVARAAVDAAAVTEDEGGAAERAVASARVVASEAAAQAARASIQVHGGMGYTWELDAHVLLKRVLVLDQTPSTVEDALEVLLSPSEVVAS